MKKLIKKIFVTSFSLLFLFCINFSTAQAYGSTTVTKSVTASYVSSSSLNASAFTVTSRLIKDMGTEYVGVESVRVSVDS